MHHPSTLASASSHPFVEAVAVAVALASIGFVGCKDERRSAPMGAPPPNVVASSSGSPSTKSACEPSSVGFADARTAAVLPPSVAGFCVHRDDTPEIWGEGTSKDVKDIADAIDGAGDVYVRDFFAKRFEIVKYVEATGSQAQIELWVSTFDKPESAYGLYAYRVVANRDPDPAAAKAAGARPWSAIAVSGEAVLGTAQAFLWKGNHVVEMTYDADPSKTAEEATAEADRALPMMAKAVGEKILGSTELPLDVRLLPTEQEGRIPLGVDYVPPKYTRPEGKNEALKVTVPGGYALAYMKDEDKRYRVIAVARDEVDAARDAIASFQKLPGAVVMKVDKQTADDAWTFPFAVGSGGPGAEGKAEGVVMRKGRIVLAVIDDELALGDAAKKDGWPRLSRDEKVAKLHALLAVRSGPPGPMPAASNVPAAK